MTHGVGFDRKYWDHYYNNFNYSYVARAVDEHGYSTLTWDRLGIGASSKGHPIDEIQIFLEIAALKELTLLAKAGKLPRISTKFDKVVHLGHSFGSVMTYALSSMYPDLSDAVVLTGFSHIFNFIAGFMLGNNFRPVKQSPTLAPLYPEGYVASASESSMHIDFFAEADFDPGMLRMSYLLGQPAAPAELLTVGMPAMEKSEFKGPVLIITGGKFPVHFYHVSTADSFRAGSALLRERLPRHEECWRGASLDSRRIQRLLSQGLQVQHHGCSRGWAWTELRLFAHIYL